MPDPTTPTPKYIYWHVVLYVGAPCGPPLAGGQPIADFRFDDVGPGWGSKEEADKFAEAIRMLHPTLKVEVESDA